MSEIDEYIPVKAGALEARLARKLNEVIDAVNELKVGFDSATPRYIAVRVETSAASSPVLCSACNDTGKDEIGRPCYNCPEEPIQQPDTCSKCGGSGKLGYDLELSHDCPTCNGTGKKSRVWYDGPHAFECVKVMTRDEAIKYGGDEPNPPLDPTTETVKRYCWVCHNWRYDGSFYCSKKYQVCNPLSVLDPMACNGKDFQLKKELAE